MSEKNDDGLPATREAGHFLAIGHDPDSDFVYGVYGSFESARDDLAARRGEVERIRAESRANRKPGHIGDPGPYVPLGEYGVADAVIEQWVGRDRVAVWERAWSSDEWSLDYRAPVSLEGDK